MSHLERLNQICPSPNLRLRALTPEELGLDEPGVQAGAERVNRAALTVLMPSTRNFEPAKKRGFLSGRVHVGQDVVTDVSFAIRTLLGLTDQGSTALDATLGNSTGINAWLAYNSYESATSDEMQASAMGYHEKARVAQLARVRSATTILTGGLYFGIRGLSLASYVKGVDTSSATAPTLLGRVTFVLSSVGGALWGAVYGLLAAAKGLEIWNARDFRRELDEACNDPEKLGAFIAKWRCSDQNELYKSAGVKDEYTEAEKAALREEALASEAEHLKILMKEDGVPEIDERKRREIVSSLMRKEYGDNAQEQLVSLGGEWRIAKLQAMRKLKVESLTSKACAEKLFGENVDSAALVHEMKSAMNKSFWINLGLVVAGVVGVAATIGAFIATAGLGPLLVTLAFLVASLMLTGIDGYTLHQEISSEGVEGRFDKKMLAISSAISIASFIGSIVLVSVLSLGIVPLISSIVIFAVWLGVNGKVWSALNAKEQEGANAPADNDWMLADDEDEETPDQIVPVITPLFQELYFPALSEKQVKNLLLHKNA